MKKFAENVIVHGTAIALLVALTASHVHAQNNTIYRPEPLKPNPVQVSNLWNTPQKNVPQQVQLPQQRLPIVPVTAVMPNHQPNHHQMLPAVSAKHAVPIVVQPVVPANHIAVNPPHFYHQEPQKTVIVKQPQVIVVQPPPKKSLLEKLFDKIF